MSSDNSYGQQFGDIFGVDVSYLHPHGGHFFKHQEPRREGFLLYDADRHISSLVRSRTVSDLLILNSMHNYYFFHLILYY